MSRARRGRSTRARPWHRRDSQALGSRVLVATPSFTLFAHSGDASPRTFNPGHSNDFHVQLAVCSWRPRQCEWSPSPVWECAAAMPYHRGPQRRLCQRRATGSRLTKRRDGLGPLGLGPRPLAAGAATSGSSGPCASGRDPTRPPSPESEKSHRYNGIVGSACNHS